MKRAWIIRWDDPHAARSAPHGIGVARCDHCGVNGGIPDDTTIFTERLALSAITVGDADELVGVLSDDHLHEFIGGRPATLDELRQRYRDLVAGSNEPSEIWLNWIVRRTSTRSQLGRSKPPSPSPPTDSRLPTWPG